LLKKRRTILSIDEIVSMIVENGGMSVDALAEKLRAVNSWNEVVVNSLRLNPALRFVLSVDGGVINHRVEVVA
jgi:hypothetical protein